MLVQSGQYANGYNMKKVIFQSDKSNTMCVCGGVDLQYISLSKNYKYMYAYKYWEKK